MNRFFATVMISFIGVLPAFADEAAAKAVVERAVKAAKWDKLPLQLNMTWKDKGSLTAMGFKLDYVADWAFSAPDKYRFVMKAAFMGQNIEITAVVNGDKAWEAAMGQAREITNEKLEYTLSEAHLFYVLSLNPLLKDPPFILKSIGDKDVAGSAAAGVEVSRKGKPTIKLFFDKKSGLLAKSEMMVKDEFQNWKEVLDESYFTDWKDAGDIKVYGKMKLVRDGKSTIESEFSDQKRPEKLDPKLFEKLTGK